MKLYLSSYFFGNNPEHLVKMIGPGKKVAIIMNAADIYGNEKRPTYLANEDEYADVFDRSFALHINKGTLLTRLSSRTSNNFGKSDHELQGILSWYESLEKWYKDIGAVKIDATKPIGWVFDQICGIITL